jgi:hypothetical protein
VTPTQAQAALKRPLKFGDPEQIEAMILVEQVEAAVAAMLKCPHSYAQRTELCSCLEGFRPEVLNAATRYDEVRNRKPCWAWEIRTCVRQLAKADKSPRA